MIYGSVCSGIEAVTRAWEPLGWRPAWFAEDGSDGPLPVAYLAHHYPEVPNLGDFTRIGAEHGPVDVLVGGTPCQSFSNAGGRAGLDDPRGLLALEFLALARRLAPRWLVWENVPGALSIDDGRAFGAILGTLAECGYGFAYRILDAQWFGVPQRRQRVFIVGHSGAAWQRAAAVLLERACLSGHPPPSRQAWAEVAAPLTRSSGDEGGGIDPDPGRFVVTAPRKPGDGQSLRNGSVVAGTLTGRSRSACAKGTEGRLVAYQCHGTNVGEMGTLRKGNGHVGSGVPFLAYGGNDTRGPVDVATACNAKGGAGRMDFESETFIANTLRGEAHDASEDGAGRGTLVTAQGGARAGEVLSVRRLMPVECERLQGFPDGATAIPLRGKPAADGPRYRAIGNSMAVPVLAWIGRRIQAVEEVLR